MADSAVATTSAAPKAVKPKKATKPKTPAAHPKYLDMTSAAISALKERGGSSRQAILKYIMSNYKLGDDQKGINSHLKTALKSGVKNGKLKQQKGTGASGSFKLAEKPKAAKTTKKAAPKKATPKKSVKKASPKKAVAKKPASKKSSPKKVAKKAASPKKIAAKKPVAAKKPKVAAKKASPKKTPAKKAAKK